MSIFDRWKKKMKTPSPARETAGAPSTKQGDGAVSDGSAPKATALPRGGVLLRAIVSEKAAAREAFGTYVFMVDRRANKRMIKDAVRAQYGMMPTSVRVANVEGKARRVGRILGRRSDWKKAVVTLPKGKTITVHEGV